MRIAQFKIWLLLLLVGLGHVSHAQDSLAQTGDTTAILPTQDTLVIVQQPPALFDIGETPKEQEPVKPTDILKLFSLSKVLYALILVVISYILINFLARLLNGFAERSAAYRLTVKRVVPIIRVIAWICVIYIVIAGIFKPPIQTVLAVSASVGLAVGFASQDILKNIFGGLVIIFDRPFSVGDKIEVGKYYGEVKNIGLRTTRIITPDDSLVSVPNAEMMTQMVSNSNTGEANCQVVAEIYLPLDINTQKAREIALQSAKVSKYIYLNKPIVVLFFNEVKHNRSYLKMRLKAYVMDIRDEFSFKSDMTEIVVREFISEGLMDPDEMK